MEHYAAHRTFRTCFRLSAPEESAGPVAEEPTSPAAEEPWRVEILLQAKDDPSVLVAAADVWSSNGDGLRLLGHLPRQSPGAAARRSRPRAAAVARARAGAARGGADRRRARLRGRVPLPRDAAPALEAGGFARALAVAAAFATCALQLKLHGPQPSRSWEDGSGLFGIDGLCALRVADRGRRRDADAWRSCGAGGA